MKKLLVIFAVAFLSGCAVDSTGLHPEQLTRPEHLRTERNLPMTFPEIQMALFRHDAACGAGPVFKMKEGKTSYATILESDSAERPWNQSIVFDLVWLQPTLRFDTRTRVYVYSFYSDANVQRRIDAVFNAVLKPGQCGLDDAPED